MDLGNNNIMEVVLEKGKADITSASQDATAQDGTAQDDAAAADDGTADDGTVDDGSDYVDESAAE